VVILALALGATAEAVEIVKVGQPIPVDLAAKKLDGTEVKIAEIAMGKETLLIFFNTVCKNCYSEIKMVDKLYSKDGKVNVFAVGVDMQGEKILAPFRDRAELQFEILSDPAFAVPSAFGVTFTPASVVIDAEGKLAEGLPGYTEDTRAKIEALFGKK
jgi:peroxiredoxin